MKTYTNGKVTVKEAPEVNKLTLKKGVLYHGCKGCYFKKDCDKREEFGINSCTYPESVIYVKVK